MIVLSATVKLGTLNYKTEDHEFDTEKQFDNWLTNDADGKVTSIHKMYKTVSRNEAKQLWDDKAIYAYDEKKEPTQLNLGIDNLIIGELKDNVSLLIEF